MRSGISMYGNGYTKATGEKSYTTTRRTTMPKQVKTHEDMTIDEMKKRARNLDVRKNAILKEIAAINTEQSQLGDAHKRMMQRQVVG
jgi:hypothetical protein